MCWPPSSTAHLWIGICRRISTRRRRSPWPRPSLPEQRRSRLIRRPEVEPMTQFKRVALAGLLMLVPMMSGLSSVPADEKLPPLDLLVIAPHPDDEAIGCTAVMLQALERKQRVGVVVVTNGDAFAGVTIVAKKTP